MSKFQRGIILFYAISCLLEFSFVLLRLAHVINWSWLWVNIPLVIGVTGFVILGVWLLFMGSGEESAKLSPTMEGHPVSKDEQQALRILDIMTKKDLRKLLDDYDKVILTVRRGDFLHHVHGTNGNSRLIDLNNALRGTFRTFHEFKPFKTFKDGKD